jgi:hypothetical protein
VLARYAKLDTFPASKDLLIATNACLVLLQMLIIVQDVLIALLARFQTAKELNA